MSNVSLKEEARLYFLPIILGNGKEAHRISGLLWRRYGLVSYILAPRRSARDLLDVSSRFVPLVSEHEDLLCMQLTHTATINPYRLPLLISTDQQYTELVEKNRKRLEPLFVICSPESLLEDSPLAALRTSFT